MFVGELGISLLVSSGPLGLLSGRLVFLLIWWRGGPSCSANHPSIGVGESRERSTASVTGNRSFVCPLGGVRPVPYGYVAVGLRHLPL